MIIAKDNPIGVDFMIDKLQRKLDSNLGWANTDIYGRVYLNTNKSGKIIAEAYLGNGKYKDIFIDSKKNAIFGFVEANTRVLNKTGKMQISTIDVVCTTMLEDFASDTLRNDEEALQTVAMIISKTSGWLIKSIRTGNVANVLNFMDTKGITFRDMQPYANFAIRCEVNYLNNICKL